MISKSPDNQDTTLSTTGQPALRVASFYPRQGSWTEADYLGLDGGPLVEFENGVIEVLDMPKQRAPTDCPVPISLALSTCLHRKRGRSLHGSASSETVAGKVSRADVVFVRTDRQEHLGYPDADLVIEVVSSDRDSRRRDTVIKRGEYARAKIAEYWIVDPEQQQIEVLVCDEGSQAYRQHGLFVVGQIATSVMFRELAISVHEVLAASLPQQSC